MRIAYEDVRIAPCGLLAKEMVSHSLEDTLEYNETLSDGARRIEVHWKETMYQLTEKILNIRQWC